MRVTWQHKIRHIQSMQSLREVPFRRVAIFGTLPSRIGSAKDITEASQVNERVKIFRSEEDARAWLKQAAHPIRTKIQEKAPRIRPGK